MRVFLSAIRNSGGPQFKVLCKRVHRLGMVFVRITAVSAIQGCPQGGVPLYPLRQMPEKGGVFKGGCTVLGSHTHLKLVC